MDEDKTRVIRRSQPEPSADPDRTTTPQPPPPPPPSSEGGDKTVLIGRPVRPKTPGSNPFEAGDAMPDAADDPVVGWLVVFKGPGRGNALRLGNGWNAIGRDASQRVRLDFGDTMISRSNHAKILYDPRARKFTITPGDGLNPAYVRGEALVAPQEVNSQDMIQLGETELRFVALCGKDFDWQEQA